MKVRVAGEITINNLPFSEISGLVHLGNILLLCTKEVNESDHTLSIQLWSVPEVITLIVYAQLCYYRNVVYPSVILANLYTTSQRETAITNHIATAVTGALFQAELQALKQHAERSFLLQHIIVVITSHEKRNIYKLGNTARRLWEKRTKFVSRFCAMLRNASLITLIHMFKFMLSNYVPHISSQGILFRFPK